ncbi:hypothetical protein [Acidisoma sp. C75]
MTRRTRSSAGLAGLSLAWNVPQVVALRLAKIARGGKPAKAESNLMVSEKIATALQAQAIMARSMLAGAPEKGSKAVTKLYARKVAANRRRLGKG